MSSLVDLGNTGSKEALRVVAFGDSITEAGHQDLANRWPEIVRLALCERLPHRFVQVTNAGKGGNTSREGLERIERDVLVHHPHFVLVEFGNDCTPEPDRHVSLDEYGSNLNQIRMKVMERSNGGLIVLTFPPVIDKLLTINQDYFRKNGGADFCQGLYRNVVRRFANEHGLLLVDLDHVLREKISLHGEDKFILPDGVHLSARGNKVVAEAVLEILCSNIGR